MSAWCRAVVFVLVFVFAVRPAFADFEVNTCGQSVIGRAVLTADLDCSSKSGVGVQIEGTLELNGHTIIGPAQSFAIYCTDNCKVLGPGTVTGSTGAGVLGSRVTKLKDVTVTGLAKAIDLSARDGKGRGVIQGCTLTGNQHAIVSDVPLQIIDSVVTNTAFSAVEISQPFPGPIEECVSLRLIVKNSTVTGSGSDPACGVDRACADLVTCGKKPRVARSTCETSCQGRDLPCTGWGVCSLDP